MILGIGLILLSLIGLIFGVVQSQNTYTILSVIVLILIAILYLVYSYLYALTPY